VTGTHRYIGGRMSLGHDEPGIFTEAFSVVLSDPVRLV
jgi:hypothetical protein